MLHQTVISSCLNLCCTVAGDKVNHLRAAKAEIYPKCIHAIPSLTVGSHGDEGGGGEEQNEDHVTAEEEPTQCGQVVEPGGCVSVQRLVEERLEVGLTPKCPNCP